MSCRGRGREGGKGSGLFREIIGELYRHLFRGLVDRQLLVVAIPCFKEDGMEGFFGKAGGRSIFSKFEEGAELKGGFTKNGDTHSVLIRSW